MIFNKLNAPTQGGSEQYYLIDLLRGIASITVIIVHYKHFFLGVNPIGDYQSIHHVGSFAAWAPIFYWGSNVVQLFWLISGFVFLHVYSGQSQETWRLFLSKRFARLYPLHFITLIIVLAAQAYSFAKFGGYNIYQHNDIQHFVLNLLFASEWGFQSGRSFNGPIWSVSVEIFSYLAFFATIRYMKLSLFKIIMLLGFSTILYAYTKSAILLCLLYFLFGCLTYALIKISDAYSLKTTLIISSVTFISLLALAFTNQAIPKFLIYAPMFGALVAILATIEKMYQTKSLSKFKWIGDTSYGNYLWHSPLQMLFLILVSEKMIDGSIVYSAYFIVFYILVVIGVSIFSFHYYEKPMQKYFRKRLASP